MYVTKSLLILTTAINSFFKFLLISFNTLSSFVHSWTFNLPRDPWRHSSWRVWKNNNHVSLRELARDGDGHYGAGRACYMSLHTEENHVNKGA